ncbi:proteasome subunit alpha type 6 protein [Rutstroemia sp. NJR-2017a BBW]|nr:proteasome subunit alpha type 6 protein [Rutstroemia sp. NJR-2017a BBW]
MTASPPASGGAPRIPSWKRLGLKLKSAQKSPDQIPQLPSIESTKATETPDKKRQRESEHDLSEPRPSIIGTTTPKLSRKKSVTFTPDTKSQDGDSIKQLFLGWVAEQKAQDEFYASVTNQAFDTPLPPKVEEQFDTTLPESERRIKRVKKAKAEPNTQNKSAKKSKVTKPNTSRPFLAYLRHYHESRDTWKFNKNHQNHLLKHAFDVSVIPSDHAHLLYEYIRSLQGGVRTRLRDAALAIKIKDQEEGAEGFPADMSDRNKRQREYDVAMNEYVATMTAAGASPHLGYEEGVLMGLSDSAMSGRAAKRMRSEQILAELGSSSSDDTAETQTTETESVATDGEKRLRLNDGTAQKVGRRRKQRTLADVDGSSSSSDSSSDSDDSSSEDESSTPGGASGKSTSSSSSSSSDSESDDEESSSDDSTSSSESDDTDGIA